MSMRRFLTLFCAFLLAIRFGNGLLCARNPAQINANKVANSAAKSVENVANDATSGTSHSDLRLGPGDLLELKVFNAPELSGTLR